MRDICANSTKMTPISNWFWKLETRGETQCDDYQAGNIAKRAGFILGRICVNKGPLLWG